MEFRGAFMKDRGVGGGSRGGLKKGGEGWADVGGVRVGDRGQAFTRVLIPHLREYLEDGRQRPTKRGSWKSIHVMSNSTGMRRGQGGGMRDNAILGARRSQEVLK